MQHKELEGGIGKILLEVLMPFIEWYDLKADADQLKIHFINAGGATKIIEKRYK